MKILSKPFRNFSHPGVEYFSGQRAFANKKREHSFDSQFLKITAYNSTAVSEPGKDSCLSVVLSFGNAQKQA